MRIDLTPIAQLSLLVLAFYLTVGLMAVGAGLMLGQATGAIAVARFFFVRPLELLAVVVAATLVWMRDKTWDVLRWMLTRTWRIMRDFVLWPVARGSMTILRLAAVGFADTLHFLFTGRGR